jgi:DNA-binding CsgD family transcriptional regulator
MSKFVSSGMARGRSVLAGREIQILGRLAGGTSPKDVARSLVISRRTIDFHLLNVYRKLGVTNRIQAILAAGRLNIIPLVSQITSERSNCELEAELISNCPELHRSWGDK